jgi:putative DNA topoisomerase
MSAIDKSLFTQHAHALEDKGQVCPDCSSELHIKQGKSGPFLACSNYPSCHYTRAVVEHERIEDKILVGSECPLCGHELSVKQGRFGMFIGCSNFPTCHHIEQEPQETLEDLACPQCNNGLLQEKTSRFGKKFYACNCYPKCKFVVNHQPIAGQCEKCQFPLLLKRNMAAGVKYQCADKKCSAMQKIKE